ncbi:ABC transporter glutamine-binding protein GlnH [Pseudoclavibacter triregionum]|nr:ABC transporter glutamine-binding protein GlnH [Pseudoclavibacter triregionum]
MKLKSLIAAGALALTAALSLTACTDSGAAGGGATNPPVNTEASFEAGTTMARLHDAGTITIGTKFDQPLFGLMGTSGKPEGFDVEMGKIIAAELGIKPENINWVETVSQNREPFIQNGQVDLVIATYTINDKRKEVIDFAGPYYTAGQSFLVPAANPKGITSDPATLGDATICTVTGSTSEKNIRQHTQNVITVDKYSDCLEPIRTGQADALTTDNVILAGLVAQNGTEFKVVDGTFTSEPYGIGIAKGDQAFRDFINDTIEAAVADGRWEQAWTSTAGTVLPTPEAPKVDRY